MPKSPVIKLEGVWKIYRLGKIEVPALRGLTLGVEPGSFVSIIGPSGSGKSSLLHLVGCLDLPTRGRVFLEGQDIAQLSENRLAQIRGRKIGFVFQQFNLIPNLTALENVMLPMAFFGQREQQREERSRTLLDELGLIGRLSHRPLELSGGEQQRVAIARALANNPEVILADEPTGNLDSATGEKIMEILRGLHTRERKTIIVVTHDPSIAGYSDEIVHLKDGQVVPNHIQREKVLW